MPFFRFPSLCSATLALLLFAGCVSTKSMPFETFAKVERGAAVLPPECIEAARKELTAIARSERSVSAEVLAFWEEEARANALYLEDSTDDPAVLDRQIEVLCGVYTAYRHKGALLAEMLDTAWPYGLKDYNLERRSRPIGLPNPPTARASTAAKAWPLWVWGTRTPAGAFPEQYSHLNSRWPSIYAAHRREIHTFWLAVKLAIDRQKQQIAMFAPPAGSRAAGAPSEEEVLASWPTTALPMAQGDDKRLFQLLGAFRNYSAFMRDHRRYKPLSADAGACPLPRSEVYGTGDAWTSVLFSKAKGLQWLASGRYSTGVAELGDSALYRQEGGGWFLLPCIGFASGSVVRYPLGEEGVSSPGPPERLASLQTLWPLYIYGKGKGFTTDGATAEGVAMGVPLIYAYARVRNDEGLEARVHEALHFLLYAGVRIKDGRTLFTGHSVGLGVLWLSTSNSRTDNVYNGPLWGLFGPGRANGEPVFRVFGWPFKTGKRRP